MDVSHRYPADCRPPALETERLRLRPFRPADQQQLEKLLNDRQIIANTNISTSEEGNCLQWINNQDFLWKQGRSAVFAISKRLGTCGPGNFQSESGSTIDLSGEEDELIGGMGLEIDPQHHRAELGFWIGKPFRGQGYATEAGRAVIGFGFSVIGLNKITATHLAPNNDSKKVLIKLGFVVEGVLKRQIRRSGQYYDLVCHGLLRDRLESA